MRVHACACSCAPPKRSNKFIRPTRNGNRPQLPIRGDQPIYVGPVFHRLNQMYMRVHACTCVCMRVHVPVLLQSDQTNSSDQQEMETDLNFRSEVTNQFMLDLFFTDSTRCTCVYMRVHACACVCMFLCSSKAIKQIHPTNKKWKPTSTSD